MRLNEIGIHNFRNIESLFIQPCPNVNVIYGDNGQGKTNLIEAIHLLSGQKSFRGAKDQDLIRFKSDVARIEGKFQSNDNVRNIALAIGQKKIGWLSDIECPVSNFTGEFLTVVFSPSELALIQSGPLERRNFLDGAISQVMPRYMSTLSNFNKVLSHRNILITELVKNNFSPSMVELLDTWNLSFAKYSYSVFHARARYLNRLKNPTSKIYESISNSVNQRLNIIYQPSIDGPNHADWADVSISDGESYILNQLEKNQSDDFKNFCSTIGPHRDNFEVLIDGINSRTFGSQGQQRSCALSLKLAQCQVMEEILGDSPIVLLDDVLSELDKTRRDYFLKGEHKGQVFITCCDKQVPRAMNNGLSFLMKNGLIVKKSSFRKKG